MKMRKRRNLILMKMKKSILGNKNNEQSRYRKGV